MAGAALAVAGCVSPPSPDPAAFAAIRYATAGDGVRLAYRDSGGRGVPLLFCTGGGQTMAAWDLVAVPLWKTRRVILHDRRGLGQSDAGAPESHSFDTFAADALAVLDDAKVRQADVCGLAFGARVAMRVPMMAPERTRRLILFDATGGPAASEELRAAGAAEARRLRDAAGIATPARDPAWSAHRDPAAAQLNARAFNNQPDWLPGLDRIRVPTLVAVGEQDPNLPGSKRLAQEIPGARFVLMPMTGHGSNAQRPDLLRKLIEEFLAA
jgi:pimeloyl-ACP methyl ester carboxylesterase